MAWTKTKTIVASVIAATALAAAVAVPGIAAALPAPADGVVDTVPTAPRSGDAPGDEASSHGAHVSAVARDKSGDVTNHGARVSEVARQNGAAHRSESADGDTEDDDPDEDGASGNAYGHDKGVGNPHRDDEADD